MDLNKLLHQYNNLSKEEIQKFWDCSRGDDKEFRRKLIRSHEHREIEKKVGRPALLSGPLLHVLSVNVQPKTPEDKPISIYGRLRVEFRDSIYGGVVGHDLYLNDTPEILDINGTLTLNYPSYLCDPDHACMPLFRSQIIAELFDGFGNVFARNRFSLDDDKVEGEFEQVRSLSLPCEQGLLVIKYIVIPFGMYCRIHISFLDKDDSKKRDFIMVNGKVVARYANMFGNCTTEESVLFKKQISDFERIEVGGPRMNLSRCWVALPGYSSLVVDLNLSEFETGRQIVVDSLKLVPQAGWMTGDTLVLDDLLIQVNAAWFPPNPVGPRYRDRDYPHKKLRANVSPSLPPIQRETDRDIESTDKNSPRMHQMTMLEVEEMDNDCEDEYSSDEDLSSGLASPWGVHPHRRKPWSSPAMEIFSVFIGRENSKALRIFGSIEFLCHDERICYIFKREENEAFLLTKDMKSTMILDGSRERRCLEPVKIKVDIKDVEGLVTIKGFHDWGAEELENSHFSNKQLCSFIQGQNGFAAVHYSIFDRAVAASISVSVTLKKGCANVYPMIYGSLISQYSGYDYSSMYNQDYYRCVLFLKTKDDAIQLNADCLVSLSRSMVVVPLYSSLILNVHLSTVAPEQTLFCTKQLAIGDEHVTAETSDMLLRIDVDWCDIK